VRVVPRRRLTFRLNSTVLIVALVVSAVDAISKVWARHALARPEHVVGPLWWHLQYNAGVSFSLSSHSATVTTVATLIVTLLVLGFSLNAARGTATAGFGLLLGGGVANVIDRLAATPHEVTDFIAVGTFPVFNLADASVTIGFVILLVLALSGEGLLTS